MRELIKGADLAIANFENPAPNSFRYHTGGTVFSADPELIDGLANAGIDWVSLANNHIRDAGAQRHPRRRSPTSRSAGIKSTAAPARTSPRRASPAILERAG